MSPVGGLIVGYLGLATQVFFFTLEVRYPRAAIASSVQVLVVMVSATRVRVPATRCAGRCRQPALGSGREAVHREGTEQD
jgi:hypothetical protein